MITLTDTQANVAFLAALSQLVIALTGLIAAIRGIQVSKANSVKLDAHTEQIADVKDTVNGKMEDIVAFHDEIATDRVNEAVRVGIVNVASAVKDGELKAALLAATDKRRDDNFGSRSEP